MKHLIKICAVSTMLMLSNSAMADNKAPATAKKTNAKAEKAAPAAPALKIGVLDIRYIMANAQEVKDNQAALQAEYQPKIEEIQALDKGLRENVEKLQRDRDVLSEAQRTKLETEIQGTQQELMKLQNLYSKESTEKQQKMMQVFLDKVKAEVETYAKKEKFDMILIADAVPYVNDKAEVTQEILKRIK